MANCIRCGVYCCSCSGCVLFEGKYCPTCTPIIIEERKKEEEEKKKQEQLKVENATK